MEVEPSTTGRITRRKHLLPILFTAGIFLQCPQKLVLPLISLLLIALVGLIAWKLWTRKPWPFKVLQAKGVHQSAPLPSQGSDFEERKRDFARVVTPSSKPGLYVVTAAVGTPVPWTSSVKHDSGDVGKGVADAVFEEFSAWLKKEATGTLTEGLAQRVVSLVAASEGFLFAMKHQVPPSFPQTKFVVVMSSTGEVRVLWLAFATHEPKPNLTSTPFILKLLSQDVNKQSSEADATKTGIEMEYVVVHAQDKDLDDYVSKKQAGALSRAAVESSWEEILGSV